jgi:hypothetical protein
MLLIENSINKFETTSSVEIRSFQSYILRFLIEYNYERERENI